MRSRKNDAAQLRVVCRGLALKLGAGPTGWNRCLLAVFGDPFRWFGFQAAIDLHVTFPCPAIAPHGPVTGDERLRKPIGRVGLGLRQTDPAILPRLKQRQQLFDDVGVEQVVVYEHDLRGLVSPNLLIQPAEIVDLRGGKGHVVDAKPGSRGMIVGLPASAHRRC